eukprot:COSAG06_NODE_9945_length_1784_cov_2.295549_3_plen_91_part_01
MLLQLRTDIAADTRVLDGFYHHQATAFSTDPMHDVNIWARLTLRIHPTAVCDVRPCMCMQACSASLWRQCRVVEIQIIALPSELSKLVGYE